MADDGSALVSLEYYVKFLRHSDGLKPKFKWLGDKEELGKFIYLVFDNPSSNDDTPNNVMIWSEDLSHNMVSCKAFGLSFKLYTTTKTLWIQGKEERQAKEKVFNLIKRFETCDLTGDAQEMNNNNSNMADNETESESDEDQDDSGEVNFEPSIVDITEPEQGSPSVDLVEEISSLRRDYNVLKHNVDYLLSKPKEILNQAQGEEIEITFLRNQLAEIELNNNSLVIKNAQLENEKASLLTTIRLLREDKPLPAPINTKGKVADTKHGGDGEFTQVNGKRRRNKRRSNKVNVIPQGKPSNEKPDENTVKKRTASTLIIGDSIVKRLTSFQLSKSTKSKVVVRSFPGARIRDMYHYIQPAIDDIPKPVNVILHVGTNDLKDKPPQAVADEIIDLARSIENKYDAMVNLSDLTIRLDSDDLSKKVTDVNKITKRFCTQAERLTITHSNIDESSLNDHKLHLNSKGVAILASNFTNFVGKNH